MIIVRSPLRITLAGGGSDVLSYANRYGGFCISAAIDKYVYIMINRTFDQKIFLKYSELENVKTVDEINHPIFQEAIKLLNFKTPQLEITSTADIPAGTGLGSSGSFTTALLRALYAYRKKLITPKELAELACDIEINKLHEPIGKQDQYSAAFGGINTITFDTDGETYISSLPLSVETMWDLEENLLLFFTGFIHKASDILRIQEIKTNSEDINMIGQLNYSKELAKKIEFALIHGLTFYFGNLLHEHWMEKRKRSYNMTNPKIDEWYNLGIKNGAIGGKLVGAGGGGFLMFYAHDKKKLRSAMKEVGLEEIRFNFDWEGTKVLLS
jgi:D-glycero-alpha-D-manno-heptose-7-phosphate kinase